MGNSSPVNVLYISYDGMTDPLGQSQVIPYLEGLAKHGYHFSLLSFEKSHRFQKHSSEISARLEKSNIEWHPCTYTKKPPVLSTLWDLYKMKRKAYRLHTDKKFAIVHCRSYISSLIGLAMARTFGTKFIFDMRAFYADERVDGGIWNLSNPVYKFIYRFFKRKEIEFFTRADYSISLTQKAKGIIHSWEKIPNQPIPIQVIPCCADLELFSPKSVDEVLLKKLRKQFALSGDEFVLSYLGSIGTWYMPDEMLDFFCCLLDKLPSAKFLFITNEPPEIILSKSRLRNINDSSLIITPADHRKVPTYLALSNWSIFFIKPVFSKSGSSPTKQGEIMGMGIPHICNAGVGDVDEIMKQSEAGIVIQNFTEADYKNAIDKVINGSLVFEPESIIKSAHRFYSLEDGVEKYNAAYDKVTSYPEGG